MTTPTKADANTNLITLGYQERNNPSTILTLIGGIIPSRKAAKQDPVLALRSE